MKNRFWYSALVLSLAILACSFPSFAAGPAPTLPAPTTPPEGPSVTPPPSETPLPTLTPPPTEIPTPTIPIVTPKDQPVNCRYGPGLGWEAISGLLLGKTAEIVGKNSHFGWWYIKDPINSGEFCWVAMSATIAQGNLDLIPEVSAPVAMVTGVSVGADVAFSACGGPNVIGFSGSITTNGPTTVTYRWEVTGDKTNTTSPETLEFDAAGSRNVPDPGAYTADCGHYAIRLHVTDPNDKSAKKNFKVGP